jgi:hypothetical protein
MPDLASQAQPAVESLLQSDDDALYVELGRRLKALQDDPAVGGAFDPKLVVLEAMGPVDDIRDFGKRFFERLNGEAYKLMCSTDAEDTEERKKLLDAFPIGKEAVTAALAAGLVAWVGLAPAIAAVVAAIAMRLFFRAAYGATCDVWKENLAT